MTHEQIREYVINQIINPVLPEELVVGPVTYHVNPTGRFVVGGPHGDCGLTGRKIIVDTYGGWARHGGGAFSGKDPDEGRSQRGLHGPLRGQERRGLGTGRPLRSAVGLRHRRFRSGERAGRYRRHRQAARRAAGGLVREHFPLTPSGIIRHLNLRRPIYQKTASGGHFGRSEPEFTWEKTDRAADLAKGRQSRAVSTATRRVVTL